MRFALGLWLRPTLVLSAVLAAAASLQGCSGAGNAALENGSLGLQIQVVEGNKQSAAQNQIFKAPLIVLVTDPVLGNPVANTEVDFVQTAPDGSVCQSTAAPCTDASILNTAPTTDSNGLAFTSVRAPSAYNETVTITATVSSTSASVTFALKTVNTGLGVSFAAHTTDAACSGIPEQCVNTEIAGKPFGWVISILDEQGNVVQTANEVINMIWSFTAGKSWTGVSPKLPPAVLACNFVGGVCLTPSTYVLTDTRGVTKFWVGNGPGGLKAVFADPITVLPDEPKNLVLANAAGGPLGLDGIAGTSDDAVAYTLPIDITTDAPPFRFFATITDASGNWISDFATSQWSANTQSPPDVIDEFFCTNPDMANLTAQTPTPPCGAPPAGPSVPFTPELTGSGVLKATDTSASCNGATCVASQIPITIDPGNPDHIQITTQDNFSESAGYPFTVGLKVVDHKNNPIVNNSQGTGAYSGNFPVTISLANDNNAQGILLDNGCNRVLLSSDEYGLYGQQYCETRTFPQTFLAGSANAQLSVMLNDANIQCNPAAPNLHCGSAPVINAQIPAANGFPALVGSSPVIAVTSQGPHHIGLHVGLGDDAIGLSRATTCSYVEDPTPPSKIAISVPYCPEDSATSSPRKFVAALEDRGGNFISNPGGLLAPPVTWVTSGSYGGEWVPNTSDSVGDSYTLGQGATYTPGTAGLGVVVVTDTSTGVGTEFQGSTSVSPLDHYFIYLVDDNVPVDNTNTLDVRYTFTLFIETLDQKGNIVLTNGTVPGLNITTTGATASRKPTNPILPNPGSPSFVNGVAQIPGLRLPNSTDSITVSATDGTHPSNTVIPTIKIGPIATLAILDAANDSGHDWSAVPLPFHSAPVSNKINTDNTYTFYLATYDSEYNFIGVGTTAAWTGLSSNTSYTTPAPFVQFSPQTPTYPGTGTLTAQYLALNVTTTPIEIDPGALDHFNVWWPGTVTAGQPFNLTVTLEDFKHNTLSNFTGNLPCQIIIQSPGPNVLGYDHTGPTPPLSGGNCPVVAGFVSPQQSYTVYNASGQQYQIQYQTTNPPFRQGGVQFTPINDVLDHIRLIAGNPSEIASAIAGTTTPFQVIGRDQWGNTVANGADSNRQVTVAFSSSIGGQQFTAATSLSSPSALPNGSSVTGNLNSGYAIVNVTATDAMHGGLTFTTSAQGGMPIINSADSIADPLNILPKDVPASVVFDAGALPPSSYQASNSTSMQGFEADVLDQYGNTLYTDNTVNVRINLVCTNPPCAALGGTLTRHVVAGTATFTNVTYPRAQPIAITAQELTDNNVTANYPINVVTGPPTQSIVVLPGQTYNPGVLNIAAAVTGAPNPQTAGAPFDVTILAVDDGFNTVSTYTGNSTLVRPLVINDSHYVASGYQHFASGVAAFTVAGLGQVTATTAGANLKIQPDTSLAASNNSSAFTLLPNTAQRIVLVMPGETLDSGGSAPGSGSGTGRTGTPNTNFVIGTPIPILAYATDQWFNVVSDTSTVVTDNLTTNDPNGTYGVSLLSSGVWTVSTTFKKSFTAAVSPSTVSLTPASNNGSYTSLLASTPFIVNAGPPVRTITILPGETYVPGAANLAGAVTGSPTAEVAGTPFNAVIRAVDSAFNTAASYTTSGSAVSIVTSDANDSDPAARDFLVANNGVLTVPITNVTAGSGFKITTTSPLGTYDSDFYNINAGVPTQVITVLPNQVYHPGKQSPCVTNGAITGTGTTQTAGVSFVNNSAVTTPVTLLITDGWCNLYNDNTTTLGITTTDPYATPPATTTASGGSATFALTNVKAGSWTVSPTNNASYTPIASSAYSVVANTATKVIAVLTQLGETYDPGNTSDSGRSGTASTTWTADNTYTVDVYAVDSWFNVNTGVTSAVSVAIANDPTATAPVTPTNLVSGHAQFTITPVTATIIPGSSSLPQIHIVPTVGGLTTVNSNSYPMNPGTYANTIVQVTSAASGGSQTYNAGQTSLANAITTAGSLAQTANTAFGVKVIATDAHYNLVSPGGTVTLTPSDVNAPSNGSQTLVNGKATFSSVKFYKAASAQTITPSGVGSQASTAFNVLHGAPSFAIVAPQGLTLTQGVSTLAFTGSATTQTAGTAYPVNVFATDNVYNVLDAGNGATPFNTAGISLDFASGGDSKATPPSTSSFANGALTFASQTSYVAGVRFIRPTGTGLTLAADQNFTVSPAAPSYLATVTAPPASGTVGSTVTPKVELRDKYDNPTNAQNLIYSVQTGGGSVSPNVATAPGSSPMGDLSASWTLGTVKGSNTNSLLVAGSPALTIGTSGCPASCNASAATSITYTLNTTAATAHQLAYTVQPATPETAGVAFTTQPSVQVQDQYGNIVESGDSDAGSTVTLSAYQDSGCSTTADAGLISGNSVAAANGQANFGSLTFKHSRTPAEAVGIKTKYFKAVVTTPVALTSTCSSAVLMQPAAAASLATTTPPTTVAGVAFAPQPVVDILDAFGNLVDVGADATATITETLSTGTGALSGTQTAIPAAAGVADFTGQGLNVNLVGAKVLTATKSVTGESGSVNVQTSSFTISPAGAATLTVTGFASPSTAGNSQTITVTALDQYGNTATGYTGTVHFTSTDSHAVLPSDYTFTVGNAGVKTFSMTLETAWTNQTVTATDTVTGAITGAQTVAVQSNTGTKLVFTTPPGTGNTAGVAFGTQPILQVQDNYGNLVLPGDANAGASVTLTAFAVSGCTSADGGGWTGNVVSASSGTATFSTASYNKSGTKYIQASASGLTSACATSGITIKSASAAKLALTTPPSATATAGTAFTVQPVVSLEDTYGNLIDPGDGDVSDLIQLAAYTDSGCTTTPGTGTLASATATASLGAATFAGLSYNKAQTIYLLATDSTHGGITQTCSGVIPSTTAVSAAAAHQLVFSVEPTGGVNAGTAFPTQPTVQVQDQYGNVVLSGSGSTDTITLSPYTTSDCTTTAAPGAIASASHAASAGAWAFSGTSYNKTGTIYVKAVDSTNGGVTFACSTPSLSTNSGPAAQVAFVAPSVSATATAGVAFAVQPTVQLQDSLGNPVQAGDADANDHIQLSAFTTSDCSTTAGAVAVTNNSQQAASGTATFTNAAYTKAQTIYLKATDTDHSLTTGCTASTVAVSAAGAAQLAFTTQPSTTATAGTAFATQPVVTIEDQYGNAILNTDPDHADTIQLTAYTGAGCTSSTGGGTFHNSSLAATNGVSSFSGSYYTAAQTISIQASDSTHGGITAACATASTVVSAAGPSTLTSTITGTGPTTADNATTSSITITLLDQYSNPVSGVTPTFTATDTGSTNAYAACSSGNGSGVSTCTMTSKKAETKTLSIATPISLAGGSVVFQAGPANKLAFSTQPSTTAVAGTNFGAQPVVTVVDQYGNLVLNTDADRNDTLQLTAYTGAGCTSSTGLGTFNGSSHAASNGTATFSGVNYTKAETISIQASDSTNGGITAVCATASTVVSAAGANKLAFTTQPSTTATAGTAFATQPVVTIEDQYGNAILNTDPDHADTIQLTAYTGAGCTSSTGGGTFHNSSLAATNGVSSFSGSYYTAAQTISIQASDSTHGGITAACATASTVVSAAGPSALTSTITGTGPTTADNATNSTITITLLDPYSNPVSGVTPTFTATDTGSTNAYAACSSGNGSGVSTCTMTSKKAETKTLSIATPISLAGGTVVFQAGPAAQLAFTTQPSTTATAGTAFTSQPVVTIQDQYGNTILNTDADHADTIQLTAYTGAGCTSSTGSGTFHNSSLAATNGVSSFSGSYYTKAETISIQASDSTHGGVTAACATASTVVSAAGPSTLTSTITGTGPTTADNIAASSVTITLLDPYSNPVSGVTPTFTATDTGSTNAYAACSSGNGSGVSTCTMTSKKAETKTLSIATPISLAGGTVVFQAGPANKLAFSAQPSTTATAGTAFASQPVVTIQDQYGNTILNTDADHADVIQLTAYTGAGCTSSTGSGTFHNSSLAATNGVSSFSGSYYTKAETISIQASDSTNGGITAVCATASTVVSAAGANKLAFTTQPSTTATAGTAFATQPVVTIEDQYGNAILNTDPDHADTIQLTAYTGAGCTSSTGGGTFHNSSLAATNGVSTFSGSYYTAAQTISIQASDSTHGGITAACATASTVVSAAGPSTLTSTITGTGPTTADNATNSTITITLLDPYSNPVSGVTPTFTATDTGSTNAYAACSSGNGSGVSTCTMTSKKAETKTLSIATPISLAGGTVVFQAGPAAQLAFTTQPSTTATAGTAFTSQPVVTIQDQYGNTILNTDADHADTIQLTAYTGAGCTSSTGSGTFHNSSLAATNGVSSFSGSYYTKAETISIQASDSTHGGVTAACATASTVVSAAGANKLVFTGQPSTTAQAGTNFGSQPVVVIEDQYGNTVSSSDTIQLTAYTGAGCTSSTGSGVFNGSSVAASGGTATFSAANYTKAQTIAIQASDTTTGGITVACATSTTSVSAAGASSSTSTISGTGPVTADNLSTSSITITLLDQYSNPVSGVTPTFTATDTGSTNAYAACSSGDGSGVSTCTMTSKKAETKTLSIVTPVSVSGGTVVFQAGSANKLAFVTPPSTTATAGAAFAIQPVVAIEDQYGNLVSASDTVTLSAFTGSGCSGAATGTFGGSSIGASGGTATFGTASFSNAISIYIRANDGGLATACTTSPTVVSPAAPSILVLTGDSTSFATNACMRFQVTKQDPYGNASDGTVTTNVTMGGGAAGTFYSDEGCVTASTALALPDTMSSGYIWYADGTSQSPILTATDNASVLTQGTLSVSVSSSGAALAFTTSTGSVNSTNPSQSYTLRNNGSATSGTPTITLNTEGNPSYWSFDGSGCSSTLVATGTCTVSVSFIPGAAPNGTFTAVLQASGLPGGSSAVTVTATNP